MVSGGYSIQSPIKLVALNSQFCMVAEGGYYGIIQETTRNQFNKN